ncbi:MAG: hypothetical protein K2X87_27075, partial [Gemmataceae bacterium]|nr:hypothetical protein [Gemmataceae bacterium]
VALSTCAPDPDARDEAAAARFGEAYVRAREAAWADHRSLTARVDRLAGRPEPPALRAEREEFNRRVGFLNRVRRYDVGPDGAVLAGDDPPPPGTHLAVVRGGGRECVAVVRVGASLGGGRCATAVVRGTVRAGDEAVRRPDAGWDQVALAANARR